MPQGVKKYDEKDRQVKFSFSFIFYDIFEKNDL